MGLRIFRSFTILPGVRLNVSKTGVSLSLGPRGFSWTLGRGGVTASVDLPGKGVSYRKRWRR